MREFKFRAWDKEDKRMIVDEQDYVPLIVTNKGVMKLNPHHKEDLWSIVDEDRFNIMQYTGLKDKNSKEIYEGDILGLPDESPLYVEFSEEIGAFVIVDKFDTYGTEKYIAKDINYEAFEIVGNTYENPELLNQ